MNLIKYIFKPSFWIMNKPYNEGWDIKINNLIDNNAEITNKGRHTCELDGTVIWIHNYPYGYGTPYPNDVYRPSKATIERLANYIAINS